MRVRLRLRVREAAGDVVPRLLQAAQLWLYLLWLYLLWLYLLWLYVVPSLLQARAAVHDPQLGA